MKTQKIIKKQSILCILKEMDQFGISLDDLHREKGEISIPWCIEDIDDLILELQENESLTIEPTLTREEKFSVLKRAKNSHDAYLGLTWERLDACLRVLFDDRITSIIEE